MQQLKSKWFFSDNNLLNIRIVFHFVAFLHLVITAIVTLSIDTTVDEDPRIQAYYYVRWKLLTCWFNLLALAYLPARLYADWKTKRGEGIQRHVKILNHATDVLMTSVLMPTTVYADFMFWSMYLTYPSRMAPVLLFSYLPYWSQHSLHSVSLVVVVIDLLLTPRRRPSTMKRRLTLMSAFVLIYTFVIYYSLWKGEIVYSFLEHMDLIQLALAFGFALAMHFMIFNFQWLTIDLLWKRKVYIECVTIKHK